MKIQNFKILSVLLFFLLASCSPAAPAVPAQVVPTPQAGKAAVTGKALSAKTGQPFTGEYISLAGVNYNEKGEGAYFLDSAHSPMTKISDTGFFQFDNVAPQDYVVVVGDPTGRSAVLTDKSTGQPKIWKVESGKVLDLGDVRFDLGY